MVSECRSERCADGAVTQIDHTSPPLPSCSALVSTIIVHRHSRRFSSVLSSCVESLSTLTRRLLLISRRIRMPGHLLSFFQHTVTHATPLSASSAVHFPQSFPHSACAVLCCCAMLLCASLPMSQRSFRSFLRRGVRFPSLCQLILLSVLPLRCDVLLLLPLQRGSKPTVFREWRSSALPH